MTLREWISTGPASLLIGLALCGLLVWYLKTGVATPHAHVTVTRKAHPIRYWLVVAFYGVAATIMLLLGISKILQGQ